MATASDESKRLDDLDEIDRTSYLINLQTEAFNKITTTKDASEKQSAFANINKSLSERSENTKSSLTIHLMLTLIATTLGSPFQIGFNMGNMNTAGKVIKDFYNETYLSRNGESMPNSLLTVLWAVTVSAYCIGGMIGCALVPTLAGKFGRKRILLLNNGLAILSAVIQLNSKYAHSYELLIVGRVFVGIMCGIVSGIAPPYLAEIAPVALRGFCGTATSLGLVFGVLIGTVIGSSDLLGTEQLWPVIFALVAAPAFYSLLTLSWCPESPQYLMLSKGNEQAATKALKWLRETNDVSSEIEDMRKEREEMKNAPKFNLSDLWVLPELRRPFVISLVLQMSLQFTGVNAISFYSTAIFEMAHFSTKVAQLASIGAGVLNVVVTIVSGLVVDKAGRRTMQLIGLCGIFFSTVVLVICLVFQDSAPWLAYISVACVGIFMIFFAAGPGCIPWFMVAEMFEQGPRTAAVSVAVVVNWFSNFVVSLCYPLLQSAIDVYSFLPFSGIMFACIIFTYIFMPETKGKPISEITTMFKELTRKERMENVKDKVTNSRQ